MLLACDPGVHACGIAVFVLGKLHLAAHVPTDQLAEMRQESSLDSHDTLALERQYITFKHPRPQDIVELAFAAGYVKGLFGDLTCREYKPMDWKGNVPKKIHQKRIIARLSPEEIKIYSGSNHNVIDAIGIGLFALGRLQVKP